MQIELNYDCRANPSAVGHVIKFEADLGEYLDASLNPNGHKMNTKIWLKWKQKWMQSAKIQVMSRIGNSKVENYRKIL